MPGLLDSARTESGSTALAQEAFDLMRELYPICRSLTGDGVRRTLDRIARWAPLTRTELATGTPLYDWEVPNEWNVRDAFIKDASGRRLVDFREHSLHLVGYSVPVRCRLTLEELQPHLHSLPQHPDWIPYRTSYYRESWGFCLTDRARAQLGPGPFEVVIDADLAPGHLTYGEVLVKGRTTGEALVYTHVCHPALANDNLTGVAVAAALARELSRTVPRLNWRFIFGPGTLGSLAWLCRNEDLLSRIQGGLVVGLLGDPGAITYKRSRRGNTATDRAVSYVLRATGVRAQQIDFEPYGYDERQFCSPGFDLPIGRLTRSANGRYPQYHSSADDLSLVRVDSLAESMRVLATAIEAIDANRSVISMCPRGEPRLGKRGLYPDLGGLAPGQFENALLWVMNLADGHHDLLAVAERSGLEFDLVQRACAALEAAELVRGAA